MQQKTINLRNQGWFDKKFDFFPKTLSPIPRWVRLVQKTRAKNSHAWAPLRLLPTDHFQINWDNDDEVKEKCPEAEFLDEIQTYCKS
jgi:hypothetical protein